ncbi:uncharacterized protein DUF2550 [Haloactinopolyspora alba]|uniref:Uncharacterized protein DUF2550 n=1 Tax=Haloactinopolyspora alba TaxID=648780 RepID=A0A2P8EB64_9ACTN|nr:DUF2550 domain-containing protein [Haloactinopolyspora alba]PSL06715.1 uncharacterized protein DUF2550 [Haloactinopolyspora alba]
MALVSWILVVLVALALAAVLILIALYVRRSLLQRDGGFDMCVRGSSHDGWAGGWAFGIGRYREESLEWFRTFSFTTWPKRSFQREDMTVENRRDPDSEESYELPAGHVVLVCAVENEPVEVSMSESAATAFLAWLEAAPPGGQFVD